MTTQKDDLEIKFNEIWKDLEKELVFTTEKNNEMSWDLVILKEKLEK